MRFATSVNTEVDLLSLFLVPLLSTTTKYIAANYKVDIVKLGPHLKKALKTGVEKKTLVALKDKKGSSRAAIKKYIAANHRVDIVKLGPHLKKALKAGVGKKTLVVRDRLALPSRTTPCYQHYFEGLPRDPRI